LADAVEENRRLAVATTTGEASSSLPKKIGNITFNITGSPAPLLAA
jgi:hypothetical protein